MLFSEILSSEVEVKAWSNRRPFSNSSSWPRKLKLGDMDGLRSFTNLLGGGKKIGKYESQRSGLNAQGVF